MNNKASEASEGSKVEFGAKARVVHFDRKRERSYENGMSNTYKDSRSSES
jgi:hypothetical protein